MALSLEERVVLSELAEGTCLLPAVNIARISSLTSTITLGMCLTTQEQTASVKGYVETVIPEYRDFDFRLYFRMKRSTFQDLCERIAPLLPERTLTAERKLLSTLWLLANQESYRGIADRFGLSKGSLHVIALSVCGAISSTVNEYIKLPTLNELGAVAEGFSKRCGFPKVIGAIDGTHIPISGTSCNRDAFINRKGYSSMQLQVVCDAKLQFTDIYVGWPGSVHDCRVFKNSPLRRKLEQGYLPPDFHLIGDSAYPLAPYIMVPFKDNGHVSLAEKKFNKCHASTRVDVERAIGLLKCKFRRLKYLDMQLTEEMCNFIVAACVLHNFILMREMFHDDIIGDDDHQADELIDEEALLEGLPADAVAKRNDIALLL